MDEHDEDLPDDDQADRPGAVLATTDQPVPLEVREIEDERVPEGMRCLGTFLDGTLVARCAVPPGAVDYFSRHGVFDAPRQLVLAAREEDPGLRCELYAIVPMPSGALEELSEEAEEPAAEPWADSVPSSRYEAMVSGAQDSGDDDEDDSAMAAVLLGQIVRFQKDRKHPDSLSLETVDVLERIVSGRVVEVVDKLLGDLLGD